MQQLKETDAHGVDVRLLRVVLLQAALAAGQKSQLRGEVLRRAADGAAEDGHLSVALAEHGKAKVGDHGLQVFVQQEVLHLQVAVGDVEGVQILHAGHQVVEEPPTEGQLRQAALLEVAGNVGLQAAVDGVAHEDEAPRAGLVDVVGGADVPVVQLRHQLHLLLQELLRPAAVQLLQAEDLAGELDARQAAVCREVDAMK